MEASKANLVEELHHHSKILAQPVPEDSQQHEPGDELLENESKYSSSINEEELESWL